MAIYHKYRKQFIIGLTAVLMVIGFLNIYYSLTLNTLSNDECLWIHKKMPDGKVKIEFTQVKVEGVSWNAGIRDGNYLLAIGGKPVENTSEAMVILNKYQSGQYADYTIEKAGKILQTKIHIKKLIQVNLFATALLCVIWLIVGFVVVMAKPEGYIQRLFYKTGALWVTFHMVNWIYALYAGSHSLSDIVVVCITDLICFTALTYMPFTYMHFFLSFPKPFKFTEKRLFKKIFYSIPAALLIIGVLVRAYLYSIPNFSFNMQEFKYLGKTYAIGSILLNCALFLGWVFLLINYRRLKTKGERKPITLILATYTLGFLSLLYIIALQTLTNAMVFNNPEVFLPILLIAFLPVSFGVSIFRYQLMDVSVVIKNAIFYGAATAGIALVYFLLVYGLGQGVSSFVGAEYRFVIAGVVFAIFGWAFQSSKNKFQDILTKRFYPEQFAYQNILLHFSSEISSIVGLENILDRMQSSFVAPLKLKKFGILSLNENEFTLRRNHGFNKTEMVLHDANHVSKFIFNKISLNVKPIIDRAEFKEAFGPEMEALLAEEIYTVIPLIVKNKVIGLLLFGLKFSGSEFAGKDMELLCAAANQAAISIENARLYKSEAVKLTLERDLEHARMIQNSLLPKSIPACVGLDISGIMIPAMQVGGDYYDLIRVSDDKLYVIVGDVSGKGLSASLYMSKLQTIMRYLCASGKAPKEILIEANKLIYESLEKNWFITLNIGLYNLVSKSVKFARAGHLPLLQIQKGNVSYIKPQGIGLGLEKGVVFSESLEETEIAYGEGQIFAFYSDGVTEAMNSQNQLFGEEKLCEVIKNSGDADSCAIMKNVLNAITEHRSAAEQNDDITLVVIKTGSGKV